MTLVAAPTGRTYTPNPGSTPGRALAFLRSQSTRDAELSTSALAEGSGVPTGGFVGAMQPALNAGLVFARKKGGHLRSPLFWSLVDHKARDARTGEAISPANGSQAPDGDAGIPPAKAGRNAPQEGDNRDASAEPSHGGRGSESPTARGDNVAPALGASPAFHSAGPLPGRTATLSMTGEVAVVSECGTVILFDAQRGRQLVAWLAGRAG